MKVKNIILVFAVMVGMVTASAGEHRSLRTGCKNLVRKDCKARTDCKWSSGECLKGGQVGCRRKNKTQCLAARNCEWREVKIGKMRCRRGTGTGTGIEPTTTTGNWHDTIDKIPQDVLDEVSDQLTNSSYHPGSRGNPNALCFDRHEFLVSGAVQAIGDFLYGGHDCWRFYSNIFSGTWKRNCVCRDDMSFIFSNSGMDCRCW